MNVQFDLFIYLAWVLVAGAFGATTLVLIKINKEHREQGTDLETRKVRFAAVMFTGVLTLFVFVSMLYFGAAPGSGNQQAAKEIFDRSITAMTPLAGVIIGYLFGSRQRKPGD